MIISIIVAMDKNNVIGRDNDIPWRLSADLKHFKAVTMGKPIVMGRKTHDSIGRPLPGRKNIVMTRSSEYVAEGCTVVNSLDEAIHEAGDVDEIMIMGGAGLYEQMLTHANKIYLTEVHAVVEGDVYFPKFDKTKWTEVERENHSADENNDFDYSFVVQEKT
jgi:dihydrofolate reductase